MKNWSKIKTKVNLVIDAIMLIVLMIMAGLGFLIKFVLLPGYKINELYDQNTDLFFLGLDRHEWGTIHLYFAIAFLSLLLLHIILHWKTIVAIFRQLVPVKPARVVIASFVGILALFLAIAPLYVNPEVKPLARKYMRNRVPARLGKTGQENAAITSDDSRLQEQPPEAKVKEQPAGRNESSRSADPASQSQVLSSEEESDLLHHHNENIDINGTMTLTEISARYNISVNELVKVINIPAQYANERLGRLRRRYGFELDDLRSFVSSKIESDDR